MKLQIKRIYDAPDDSDGERILVDRLWPRGVSKDKAAIDLWLKEIAPSPELRRWFDHDLKRWEEFRRRYLVEIGSNPEAVAKLREQLRKRPVTLLFATRDTEHNSARVLLEYLTAGI